MRMDKVEALTVVAATVGAALKAFHVYFARLWTVTKEEGSFCRVAPVKHNSDRWNEVGVPSIALSG